MSEVLQQSVERAEALRGVVEGIIDTYEERVRTVTSLMKQAVQRIQAFHKEQEELANRLKALLARNESLRKKDFDAMMAGVRTTQAQRGQEVSHMVDELCQKEGATIRQLRAILTGPSPSTMEEFRLLKEEMLGRPRQRERKVSQMMKLFHQDQEELTAALRRLVDKGTAARIKDLKGVVRALHLDQQGPGREVETILEEFDRVKQAVSQQWERVLATVGTEGGKKSSPLFLSQNP